jgi:hypothetical protein
VLAEVLAGGGGGGGGGLLGDDKFPEGGVGMLRSFEDTNAEPFHLYQTAASYMYRLPPFSTAISVAPMPPSNEPYKKTA